MVVRVLGSALVILAAVVAQDQSRSAGDAWKQHMDAGMALEQRGQYGQAREELEAALGAANRLPKDGRSFLSRIELGSVAASAGQYIEAEQWENDAVRLGIELYGKEGRELATPYTNLAALYRDQGDYARAEKFIRQALQLLLADPAGEPAARAHALGVLGGVLAQQGKLEEAETSLRQSAQIAEKLPAASGIVAADWSNLAGVYARMGQDVQALALYKDAYELCSKTSDGKDPNLFFILAGMAAVEARSGKYADAVSTIQTAIERSSTSGAATTILVRDALLAEAEWLHKLNREAEAKRVRKKAAEVAKAVNHNSYSQYTVDARQVAKGMAHPNGTANLN